MTDILKELEDINAELKAAVEAQEAEENSDEGQEAEEQEAEVQEEQEEAETKEAPEEKPEEKQPTNSDWARMRREKAALEKKLRDLEAPKQREEQAAQGEDPVVASLLEEHRLALAEREFLALEEKAKKDIPDLQDVTGQYFQALCVGIKTQHPRMTDADIIKTAKKHVLTKASMYVNQGHDPILELYEDAKALGFGQKMKVAEEKPEPKPDLKKIAENKKRNSGMIGAKGHGGGEITLEMAANMSPKEWSALSKEQKRAILGGDE